MLLGALTNSMLDNVLATMRNDDITLAAKNDKLILGVGKLFVEKHGIPKVQDTLQTMRELSRLLIQLWKTHENPHTQLDSYIKPGKFDTLVDAVKTLCAFKVQGSQQNVDTPSLALKIG